LWQRELQAGFAQITQRHPALAKGNTYNHLGTLGTTKRWDLCVPCVRAFVHARA
jgi:hypothetical protein